MRLADKNIVITGAGGGIGAALARRFVSEGAAHIFVSDIDHDAAIHVADEVQGTAFHGDVSDEPAVRRLIDAAVDQMGSIDLLCLNAGIATVGDFSLPNAGWQQTWDVNVMSHVYGVRAALPHMLQRGHGYFLHTASAAGLLSSIGALPYAVTKHAVVALAEWLSITYGAAGIGVSCLSPQFVATDMLKTTEGISDGYDAMVEAATIEPGVVTDAVVAGLAAEQFHILPHPEVAAFMKKRAAAPEEWLTAMRYLHRTIGGEPS